MSSETAHRKLGELLLEHGAIDSYQLSAALAHQRQWGGKIGRVLIELKFASEEAICDALAVQLGIPSVRVKPGTLDLDLLRALPQELCERNYVIPLGLTGEPGHERMRVAMSDPTNVAVVDELRFRTGRRIEVAVAPEYQIEAALRVEFSGELPLPEPSDIEPEDAYFAGREIDLDIGEAPSLMTDADVAAMPVDVLGDGLLPGEQMLDLPMSGLTPGPAVVGTLLGSKEPPGRAMLDWEAPPIPPPDLSATPPFPPRWAALAIAFDEAEPELPPLEPAPRPPPAASERAAAAAPAARAPAVEVPAARPSPAPVPVARPAGPPPTVGRVAPNVAVAPAPSVAAAPAPSAATAPAPKVATAPAPSTVAAPAPTPPAPPRPAARASPLPASRGSPLPPPVPTADEAAAAAELRAEEAGRKVSEPAGAELEAELLFRKAAEQQKLAEVGEAAVEKLETLGRPLSPAEAQVLVTLEDMAAGREVARPIAPAQMVAALVRLLIRRGLIADADIIEELSRK